MTNPERDPAAIRLEAGDTTCGIEVLEPRDVPLGGPRAMTVRRTLPQRQRSLIGAWCFVDHYGPDPVAETGGMTVTPHPHTGLQTVSWLFTGEIEHRDSAGHHAIVRPGELNLMTAGRGISHSEISTPRTEVLHGAQLWVALPEGARDGDPAFESFVPDPVRRDGLAARVFLGTLLGATSPVTTHTPLLGAELLLSPGSTHALDVDPDFEHGLLLDRGAITVDGRLARTGELVYLAPGRESLELEAGAEEVRLLLLGGPPFGEAIVMWWNFIGRTHEEVAGYRAEWQAQIEAETGEVHEPGEAGGLREPGGGRRVVPDTQLARDGRFGIVVDDHHAPIPAPPLPNVRLRSRR